MPWFPKSQDHLPLNWWRGQPVYLAALLALGGLGSLVFTALLMAVGGPLVNYLVFSFSAVADFGRVWTILTYVLVNPPEAWLWVVFSSFLLWRFGEEVEKFFGRRVFARMVLIFILAEPVFLSLFALVGIRNWPAMGIFQVEFAVFLAFVTLYPKVRLSIIFFTIEAWVLAAVILAGNALVDLAYHQWSHLILMTGEAGLAFGLVRYEQGHWSLSSAFGWIKKGVARRPEPQLRVVRRSREEPYPSAPVLDVDAILDKIGSQGIDSLTADERRLLEKASKDLGGRGK